MKVYFSEILTISAHCTLIKLWGKIYMLIEDTFVSFQNQLQESLRASEYKEDGLITIQSG